MEGMEVGGQWEGWDQKSFFAHGYDGCKVALLEPSSNMCVGVGGSSPYNTKQFSDTSRVSKTSAEL